MKIVKYLLIASLALLAIAIVGGFWFLKHTAPDYSGSYQSSSVSEGANVHFDSLGIPHISSSNSGDAYFALGYVHASERLFQMELLRRVGSGRLSEILGSELVTVDKFFRALGIGHTAKLAAASWQKSTAPWIPLTKKYLEGINYFMDTQPAPAEFLLLGIEKKHFTPEDIYLITGYMAFSFAEALKTDPILSKIASLKGGSYLEYLGIDSSAIPVTAPAALAFNTDRIVSMLPVSIWTGSNAWVVSGNRSHTGKPILANDTHIGYQQPAVWHEAELICPDHHIYGHYLAGIPFPLTGHTPDHAWGLTMFENDDLNVYYEQTKNGLYKHGEEWRKLTVINDTIHIKDEPSEAFTITSTHRGPLISSLIPHVPDSGKAEYSIWWSYTKLPANAPEVLFLFMNSKSMADARSAAAAVNAPGLNIMYANNQGDIACYSAGKIPLFERKTDTRFILDGTTGKNDPAGFLNFEQNPQTENPAEGFIVSANQKPVNLIGDSIPVYGYYAPDYRHDRLTALLKQQEKWKPEDFFKLQTDVVSTLQKDLAKHVFSGINNKAYTDLINMVGNWDGNHLTGQIEPAIWYTTLSFILKNTMQDELGPFDFGVYVNTHINKNHIPDLLINEKSIWWNNTETKKTETRKQIFSKSFKEAIAYLEQTYGENPKNWSWGKVHTLTHNHPAGAVALLGLIFNVGPFASPGGIETINNASFPLTPGEVFKVKYGAAMRNIIDLSSQKNSWSILPTGQSGHAGSDHYDDQSAAYVEGKYRPMRMTSSSIQTSESIIQFTPIQ